MATVILEAWAVRHGLSYAAIHELRQLLGVSAEIPTGLQPGSEAAAQAAVRLEAARKGVRLWRNNVGVLTDDTGRPVRFGLGNDSAKLNKELKSSDLVGWRPVTVTPEHVGRTIAQFVSREIKEPGWTYRGTPRELAQLRWIDLVAAEGGDAAFTTGEGSL